MEEEQKVKDLEANIGRIEINYESIMGSEVRIMQEVMEKLIVMDAEHSFITNKITYTAYSNEFDKVEVAEKIPFYDIVVDQKDEEEIKVEFERRD